MALIQPPADFLAGTENKKPRLGVAEASDEMALENSNRHSFSGSADEAVERLCEFDSLGFLREINLEYDAGATETVAEHRRLEPSVVEPGPHCLDGCHERVLVSERNFDGEHVLACSAYTDGRLPPLPQVTVMSIFLL